MSRPPSNPAKLRVAAGETITETTLVTALNALVWTLGEPSRAQRLLDLTGLTPDALRAGTGDPTVLAALLDFLGAHEPDLVACAADIGVEPADLIRARDALQA